MVWRVIHHVAIGMMAMTLGAAQAQQMDIWQQLRAGGHVLLIRHGEVDNLSRSTSPDASFEGCEGQYNLTELGRAQALLLGDALRKRKVPIGGVLASPLCRTRDMARIAFGNYRVFPELEQLPDGDETEQARRVEAMTKVIADHRGADNLVLVTHQPNIDALTLESVEFANVVVLKPDSKSGFRVVRVLRVNDWKR